MERITDIKIFSLYKLIIFTIFLAFSRQILTINGYATTRNKIIFDSLESIHSSFNAFTSSIGSSDDSG